MRSTPKSPRWLALLLVLGALAGATPALAQWIVKSEDGITSLKIGVLMQGRAEWLMVEDVDATDQNLYLRRGRILLGGQINPKVSFFLDTDSPGMGRPAAAGAQKSYGDVYLQDFIATYAHGDHFMIDGGLVLVPTSYNHLQSAATHLTLDYGPYTFAENDALEERIGRDTGVQARGLLAEKRLEYRVGVFQGVRGTENAANALRGTARLSFHPFGTASKSFFYSGTGFGKTRTIVFGGAADVQKDYRSLHGDVFTELPLRSGACVNFQAGVSSFDGGEFLLTLPRQTTYFGEGGYRFPDSRFALWAQAAKRDYRSDARSDQRTLQGGLTWYLDGHRANLKAALGRQTEEPIMGRPEPPARTTMSIQFQAFYF